MTCPQTVPLQSRLIMSLEIRLFHLFLLFYYLSYVQDFLLFLFWFQSRFNFVFHELLFWLPFWLPFALPNFKNPLVFRHKKSCWRESNPWPPPYQGDALPTEPHQHSQVVLFFLLAPCYIWYSIKTIVNCQQFFLQIWKFLFVHRFSCVFDNSP